MQVPEYRERASLNSGEIHAFDDLTSQFELDEEHAIDPSLLTRLYSG